jgi:hypothetical protein
MGVVVPGWNGHPVRIRTAWTATEDPCILARTDDSPNWRLPGGTGFNNINIDTDAGDFSLLLRNSPFQINSNNNSQPHLMRGQWINVVQTGQLGLGCTPGRLFGPNVNTVVTTAGVAVPANFDPSIMLFLPAAGLRNDWDGRLANQSDKGSYWCNSLGHSAISGISVAAWYLHFESYGRAFMERIPHNTGNLIRCVSE